MAAILSRPQSVNGFPWMEMLLKINRILLKCASMRLEQNSQHFAYVNLKCTFSHENVESKKKEIFS